MIEVDGLTKRFGPVTAVDGLSFTVRPGHVTGFLGPNGAGKTTTMRVILGLDAPISGRATVGGRRYDGLIRPLREVGSLLDATALHGGRTAWMHLLAIAHSNGIARSRVTEVLRLTEALLTARGAAVTPQDDGALVVTGLDAAGIGDLSATDMPNGRTASRPVPSLLTRAVDLLASEWTKFRSVRSTYWTPTRRSASARPSCPAITRACRCPGPWCPGRSWRPGSCWACAPCWGWRSGRSSGTPRA